MDAVHIEESLGTKASNNDCSSCNVCDGSARIGGSAESDKPSVGVEQILKMVKVKEAAAWLHVHPEMKKTLQWDDGTSTVHRSNVLSLMAG